MLPTWFQIVGLIKMMEDNMEMNGEFNNQENNIPKEKRIDDDNIIDAEIIEIKDIPKPVDESMSIDESMRFHKDNDIIDVEFVEIKDIPEPLDESMRLHAEYSSDVEGYQRMMEGKQ